MQALVRDVRAALRQADHLGQHLVEDAELILGQAGGDVSMCMSAHIGVQPEGYCCYLSLGGCQFVDDFQFGNALHVEAENACIESDIDFPIALAYAGKHYLRGRKACIEHGLDFASADTVDSQSGLTDDVQHLGIGIGLHGVVYMPVVVAPHLVVDGTQRLTEQGRIVVVEGCLLLFEFLYGEITFHVFGVDVFRLLNRLIIRCLLFIE